MERLIINNYIIILQEKNIFNYNYKLLIISAGFFLFAWAGLWWLFTAIALMRNLGVYDMLQTPFYYSQLPIFSRARWLMEVLRLKLYQYFIESDTDGRPHSPNRQDIFTVGYL